MSTSIYQPLSNGGYTYDAVNRRLNRPNITNTTPYKEPDYGVKPTGDSTAFTKIYDRKDGGSTRSPITGATLGMSQWGQPLTGALRQDQYGTVLAQNPQVTRTIQDEMTRYYGSAPEYNLVDIVNKVVNEGMPMDQALTLMRSGHMRSEDEQYAGNLVSAQYDPAVGSLDRELDRIARQLGIDINTQEGFGDKYGQRLEGISGALQEMLQGNADAIGQIYKTAGDRTSKAYEQADTRMSDANSLIQSLMSESANQLNLQGAEDRSFGEMAQALKDSQGINAAGKAGAVGNLSNLGADMTAIAQQSKGDAAQEYAQYQQQLIDQVMNNIAQMQFQGATQQNEVGGQIADLERARAADLATTLVDVRNARTERERQTALDKLAAEIQRGTLDLQRQQLGLSASQFDRQFGLEEQKFSHNKTIDLANLNMQRQQLEAQLNQTQDPLEQMKLQAEIDKLVAQTDQINADIMGGGANGGQFRNIEGVQQFASSLGNPQAATMFMDLLAQAQAQVPRLGLSDHEILGGLIQDPNQGLSPQQQQIMQLLLSVYEGKYSN